MDLVLNKAPIAKAVGPATESLDKDTLEFITNLQTALDESKRDVKRLKSSLEQERTARADADLSVSKLHSMAQQVLLMTREGKKDPQQVLEVLFQEIIINKRKLTEVFTQLL